MAPVHEWHRSLGSDSRAGLRQEKAFEIISQSPTPTAADRPYKKAKTLSEALKIMGFMVKDLHIDSELYDLFLTSGVWRDYAGRFLSPEQIDVEDIEGYRPAAA